MELMLEGALNSMDPHQLMVVASCFLPSEKSNEEQVSVCFRNRLVLFPTKPPTKPPINPPLTKPDPTLWTRILGSVLDSPENIRSFRERFGCIGREGKWAYDDSPRLLPWPDEMSKCDVRHWNKSSRNVALQNVHHLVGRFKKVVTQIEEITRGGKEASKQQMSKLKKLERRDDILRQQWAVRETFKYRWVVPGSDTEQQDGETAEARSSRCGGPWDRFSPEKFCNFLDQRSFLVVGDSINMLFAESIRNNIRLGAKDQASRVQWIEPTGFCQRYRVAIEKLKRPEECCWSVHACADLGFFVRIFFVRDYYLNSTEDVNEFLVDRSFNETWMDEIAPLNVSIVVMNRGAHYRPDHKFKRQVLSTLVALRNTHPELLIIVRNTPAGHPDCWQHDKPLSEKFLRIPRIDGYHWEKFGPQNEILKRLTEGLGGVYMDVNASAMWRPDRHVDWHKECLHYCHPGPVDTLVQLLFYMLQGLVVPSG